jgi:hypothetical protein
MPDPHAPPVIVAEYPNEFTATLAKQALEAEGIPCQLLGIHTAGFRAEAPGTVRLMVPAGREVEARAVLDDFDAPADPGSGPTDGLGGGPDSRLAW